MEGGSLGRDSRKSIVVLDCEKTEAIRAGGLSDICVCLLRVFLVFVFVICMFVCLIKP